MVEQSETSDKYTLQDFESFQEILAYTSRRNSATSSVSTEIHGLFPTPVRSVLEQWNNSISEECSWVSYAVTKLIISDIYLLNFRHHFLMISFLQKIIF